jgi:hypothetical protein
VEANAVGRQALQVEHGRDHPLAAEPIERPAEHKLELPPMRVRQHRRKLRPLLRALPAARVIHILARDLMAGTGAPCAELPELVLRVLPLVVR